MPPTRTRRLATRTRAAARARATGAILLMAGLAACREGRASYRVEPEHEDRPGPRIVTVPYTVAKLPPAPPSPVSYDVVRRDVESRAEWGTLRTAACPRVIDDRIEERRLYPLIDVMQGLKFVTVTNGVARGRYSQIMELTPEGRRALGGRLVEESERYVVTIAEREYLPGKERWSHPADRADRVAVELEWRWKPLNAVGQRLTLGVPQSFRDEMPGRATYVRDGDGWRLEKVWLSDDTRDYMWRVTR